MRYSQKKKTLKITPNIRKTAEHLVLNRGIVGRFGSYAPHWIWNDSRSIFPFQTKIPECHCIALFRVALNNLQSEYITWIWNHYLRADDNTLIGLLCDFAINPFTIERGWGAVCHHFRRKVLSLTKLLACRSGRGLSFRRPSTPAEWVNFLNTSMYVTEHRTFMYPCQPMW